MIWGITDAARYERRQARLAALYYKPYRWFAWRPVRLDDGRWVWWEWIEVEDLITYVNGIYSRGFWGFKWHRAIKKEERDGSNILQVSTA